jgi:hypothetical protein
MLNRRDFIKVLGMAGAAIYAPLNNLGIFTQNGVIKEIPIGELYGGFVLLPEGSPTPSFVQCAAVPILGQVVDASDNACRGETIWFDNIDDTINDLPFPIYIPRNLPNEIAFLKGHIIRFATCREIFEVRIDYGLKEEQIPLISILARPKYPQPYPVWPVYSSSTDTETGLGQSERIVSPEKVSFAPKPGIMLIADEGYVLHWIRQNILYTLINEYDRKRDNVAEFATSLGER